MQTSKLSTIVYGITSYFKEKYRHIPQIDKAIEVMIKAKVRPIDINFVLDYIANNSDPIFTEIILGSKTASKVRKIYKRKEEK